MSPRTIEFTDNQSWPGSSRTLLILACLLLCVSWLFNLSLQAQIYSGSLTGVVTDPSGAVVPGAKVKLTDVDKGFSYDTETDSTGRYVLRSLPPSKYRLSVGLIGFNTHVQDGIVLNVNQNASVDVSLKLGAETQTVDVSAAAPVLSTQDAATGQELNRTFINDLPLLGRSVYDLASLAPGIHGNNPGSGGISNGGINFISNGSRNSTADILLDGVTATGFEQNSGINDPLYTPSVDSVQEFKIQQSNFSAEIGFSGATIINMVTRSGTNAYHGSAWEFLRNNVLTANNWFNNASSIPLAPRRYNLFGGTVGGPIRKDKTFFFFSYEGTRDVNAGTYTAGVPSAAMRNGDFREICAEGFDASGLCQGDGQLWDPYSGVYDSDLGGDVRKSFIPFNRIDLYQSPGNPNLEGTKFQLAPKPGNLIDPVASKMMSYFPLPNIKVGQAGYDIYNNWLGTGSNKSNNDQFDIKVDHSFNDNNRISAKFSRGVNSSTPANPFGNQLDPTNNFGGSHTHLFAFNYTRTISPNTVLNLAYGFTRNFNDSKDYEVDPTTLGLPAYMTTSGFKTAPSIAISNYHSAGGASIGAVPWGIYFNANETHHILGSLSRIVGRHDLKMGGEWRVQRMNMHQPGEQGGYFIFDQNTTSKEPFNQGDSMASFLTGLGDPANGWTGEYEVPVYPATQSHRFAGYIQDNWKVTDKLTLNLGLRYDLETPRTERYNRMSYINPDDPSPVKAPGFENLTGVLGFVDNNNRHNNGWDKNNWGPRFGFAYKLTEKTVMRGGYGVFYSVTTRGAAGVGAYGFAGFDRFTPWVSSYNYDGETPGARLSNPFPGDPFPNGVWLPPGSSLGKLAFVGESIHGPIRDAPGANATPYEQTWTFGFQHELPGGIVLDTNYVGKKGTRLYFGGANDLNHLGPEIEGYSLDQISDLQTYVPNPFYGIISSDTSLGASEVQKSQLLLPHPQFTGMSGIAFPVANSIYHAFQLRVEKRFSRGIQFLGTYTFSKSIDDSSVTHGGLTWLGGETSLQDPNNYAIERGLSGFDVPHAVGLSYVWELPIGRNKAMGRNWHPVVDAILGGWKTNGIWSFSNGFPIQLMLSGGGTPLPTYGAQRPNLAGTLRRNEGADFLDNYFANPEVVQEPAHYAIGNAPRTLGSVRTPGISNANLSLLKSFAMDKFREGMRLEFRAEFFNAFNHPQFSRPDTALDSGSFGVISSTANSAREVQLALKFYW
jgi:hypothetical protein